MWRILGVLVLATGLALLGCSPASTTPTAAPSPEASAAAPTGSAPAPSAAPAASSSSEPVGDALAVADRVCRSGIAGAAGALTVSDIHGVLVTIVYTSTDGDSICQYKPSWGTSPVVQGPGEHLADRLTVAAPLARDANFSFSSDIGSYVWGAVGPRVASVTIEIQGAPSVAATLAGGYFLAVIPAGPPCCLFTAVARDANGKELARAK